MAFIPVPDAYSVVVNYHVGSIHMENVFGYEDAATLTQAKADTIGTVIKNAYNELTAALSTLCVFDSVVVTEESSVTGLQFTSASALPTTGTDASNPLPYQTAALISWATGTRGRSYRGRTYLAGFTEADSDGRDVNAALVEDIQDFTEIILANGHFGVISRFELNPTPPPPTIPRTSGLITPFTSATAHPLWRTQRRRATR